VGLGGAGQFTPEATQVHCCEPLANWIPTSQVADPPYGSQKGAVAAQSLLAVQAPPAATSAAQVPFRQRELLSHGTVALQGAGGLLVALPAAVQADTPAVLVAQ
jgi:hypothetical protein